jgi:hypothetical protein
MNLAVVSISGAFIAVIVGNVGSAQEYSGMRGCMGKHASGDDRNHFRVC